MTPRILVPLDSRSNLDNILSQVAATAHANQAEVYLVWFLDSPGRLGGMFSALAAIDLARTLERQARSNLHRWATRLGQEGLRVHCRLSLDGLEKLNELVQALDIDFIIAAKPARWSLNALSQISTAVLMVPAIPPHETLQGAPG